MGNEDNEKLGNDSSCKRRAEPPEAIIINLDADPKNADWLHRPHRKQKKEVRRKKTSKKDA